MKLEESFKYNCFFREEGGCLW